jgi:hypothetical protein
VIVHATTENGHLALVDVGLLSCRPQPLASSEIVDSPLGANRVGTSLLQAADSVVIGIACK